VQDSHSTSVRLTTTRSCAREPGATRTAGSATVPPAQLPSASASPNYRTESTLSKPLPTRVHQYEGQRRCGIASLLALCATSHGTHEKLSPRVPSPTSRDSGWRAWPRRGTAGASSRRATSSYTLSALTLSPLHIPRPARSFTAPFLRLLASHPAPPFKPHHDTIKIRFLLQLLRLTLRCGGAGC
jgi:hypothetical protein